MAVLEHPVAQRGAFQDFCTAAQRRTVLIVAILASAMGFVDGSVVAVAIPAIRVSLDATLSDAQWINNSYMLAVSALILVGGAAGDRFGLRRVFALGIAVFVAGSVFCALAPGAGLLIVARLVQGIGAALMIPGSLAILSKAFPREERARAIGIWASASAVMMAAGPVLGGVLLTFGSPEVWRLIFAFNLPVGAVVLWLLLARVPPDAPQGGRGLDIPGGVLAVAGLGAMAWALTAGQLVTGVIAVVLLAVFWAWEGRARDPMMPRDLFASAPFTVANLATFLIYFALAGVLFYLPMTLIAGWRLPEALAGIVFAPLSISIAVLSGPAGAWAGRAGPGPLIAAGAAVVAVSFTLLGIGIGWRSFWGHVVPSLCLFGIGMGLVVAPLSAAVMGAVAESRIGVASGINNAVSRTAGLIAVATLGVWAAYGYGAAEGPASFGEKVPQFVAGAHGLAMDHAFAGIAFLAAGLCAVAAVLAAVWLPRAAAVERG